VLEEKGASLGHCRNVRQERIFQIERSNRHQWQQEEANRRNEAGIEWSQIAKIFLSFGFKLN
jgi:hypothetical protein